MPTKIDYDAVLRDLEERRAALDLAIQAIRELALSAPREAPKTAQPAKRGRKPRADRSDLSQPFPDGSQNTSGVPHE